ENEGQLKAGFPHMEGYHGPKLPVLVLPLFDSSIDACISGKRGRRTCVVRFTLICAERQIIFLSFLWIRKNSISLVYFLKQVMRLRHSWVLVRMVSKSKLLVRYLDLILSGPSVNAQQFVQIDAHKSSQPVTTSFK